MTSSAPRAPEPVDVPGRRGGDDPRPGVHGEHDEGAAHVAAAAQDDDGLARLHPAVRVQGEVGGGGGVGQGHGVLGVDPVGQPVEPVGGDGHALGGGPLPAGVAHAVAPDAFADLEAGAGRGGGDGAGQIAADHEGKGHGRTPGSGPDEGVDVVDGGDTHVHQDLARLCHRLGEFAVPDGVGGTELFDVSGEHGAGVWQRRTGPVTTGGDSLSGRLISDRTHRAAPGRGRPIGPDGYLRGYAARP